MAITEKDSKHTNRYFAADEAGKVADILLSRMDTWRNSLESNGYMEKIRLCWAAYYGAYYTDFGSGHQVTFGGDQGELSQLPVNHLRNLAKHMLVMTTANRPAMEARSVNTDYKSLVQTQLANGLLDYYLREKRLEKYLTKAVESAIVLSAGYIKMEWNATSGEIYDYSEELETNIHEGDVEFSNLTPFDIMFDPTKESQNHDWILARSYKNRFDLIAKYPDFEQQIKNLPEKSEVKDGGVDTWGYNTTDDVNVYEFYHGRTEAMPDGRYMLFCDQDSVFIDTPLPYRRIPIYRISCDDILGTPFGYSPLFDLLPIQEAINSSYSTILTNQNAFGVQNILVPRGADITVNDLGGGLNVIECNIQAGKPEPLNLASTPKEVFDFLAMMEKAAETISGVSSVTRGNPEKSLESGAALALVQSMSLQFMSGLQAQYVQLIEDVGSGLIDVLKDFAAVPRIAAIVGKNQRTYLKEFKGDDLSSINRVIVDVGNPLAHTTAGRVQMAEHMMQMGLIKNPTDYFSVINTGNLDTMTKSYNAENNLMQGENEALINGEDVPVLAIDEHDKHIFEHRSILSDPDLRKDPQLVQRVLQHIQEHIAALQQTDPNLLGLINQKPLSPPGGTPNAPQGGPQPPPQSAEGAPPSEQGSAGGPPAMPPGAEMVQPAGVPEPSAPPAPFENAPTNPADMPPQS